MDDQSCDDSDFSYEEDYTDEEFNKYIEKKYDKETDEFLFEVLTADDVVKYMNDTIKSVISIVNISPTIARVLLNHTKWNKELLMERFFGDQCDTLFKEAKIVYPEEVKVQVKKRKCNGDDKQECDICCNEMASSNFVSLKCGHLFCSNCWNQYLQTQILDEGMADTITCPKHKCSILVDQSTCLTVLKNTKTREVYLKLITNSFVNCNPVLKWCPNRECNKAVKVEYALMRPVTCHCKTIFCFNCLQNWHSPLKCDRLKKWLSKDEDNSETMHWLTANTRHCSNCKFAIQKSGGCDHITCSNCKHEFCYACEVGWKNHRTNCTEAQDEEINRRLHARLLAERAIKRYSFYYDRYSIQKKSLELEERLIASLNIKVLRLHEHGISSTQTLLLDDSVRVLNRCRRTLMYTYPFAYFLEDNNDAYIFRDNQADLLRATEDLSDILENKIDWETIMELKPKILDLQNYCEARCNILESHVEEGYKNNTWKFIDCD